MYRTSHEWHVQVSLHFPSTLNFHAEATLELFANLADLRLPKLGQYEGIITPKVHQNPCLGRAAKLQEIAKI